MSYKVKKIIKKVQIFKDEKKYIMANDITMDELTNTPGMQKVPMLIAWFDKSKNADLVGNLSKVQFAVSETSPASVTLSQETEDVEFASMYKSNEEFTEEQLKLFVQDHANIIDMADLVNFPPEGYDTNSFVIPEGLSVNDLSIAFIKLESIASAPSHFVYAWVNKSDVQPTEIKDEIIVYN